MSTQQKTAWGLIISALTLAGGVAAFLSTAKAEASVGPVRERVVRLEERQESDRHLLERIIKAQESQDRKLYAICIVHPNAKCEDK